MNSPDKKPIIYIVDDDAFLTSLYEKKAKEFPIELRIGKSGTSALEELRAGFAPDVMAIDITMLGASGIDVLKTMREEGLAERTKVVVLSNTTDDNVVAEAKKLGVKKFIVKASLLPPQVLEELYKLVI